jgi:hypothetical protein
VTRSRAERLADVAAMLALASVALIAWSVLDPTPLAVILAVTAGQIVGTSSLLLLVTAMVLGRTGRGPPCVPVEPPPQRVPSA